MGQNFSSEPVVEKETERDHNDTFNVAVSSCQGWRMSQEDNHSLILDLPGEHKAAFFAVYDGHGSARVSKHASESLWRHLVENDLYTKGNFREALEKAFLTFDHEVNESYNAQLAGTTAVCLLIVDNIIYCANIGDSRGVACVNCECVPLSYDHKPDNPGELKRILAAGGYVLGNRVNGNLALSRAFGDFHYKGNEQLPAEQQIVSPCPDIKILDLNDDVDFLVLACDGIWDVLSSEEVVDFVIARLEQSMEPGLICEQLTTRCLATDYELVIGCDNMTVLLICYTRGRTWTDFCTDIFNKNTKRLGVARTRPSSESGSNVDMIDPSLSNTKDGSEAERLNHGDYYNILSNVLSSALTVGAKGDAESSTSSTTANQKNDEELLEMTQKEEIPQEEGTPVLRELDQEPELEQACTITEITSEMNQEVEGIENENNAIVEDLDQKESDDKSKDQQSSEANQECKITEELDDEDQKEVEPTNEEKTCQPINDSDENQFGECKVETNNDNSVEQQVETHQDDCNLETVGTTAEGETQEVADSSCSVSQSDDVSGSVES